MMRFFNIALAASLLLIVLAFHSYAEDTQTYAERLGFPKGAKVVIFHNDDAGLCHEANLASIRGREEGMITSWSLMMPCPWVTEIRDYLKKNPDTCCGIHLTLTSEWDHYRWRPVSCTDTCPGLADEDGYLWDNVRLVTEHATPDEFEAEVRAQIALAEKMGIQISHLDTHMGTVFATEEYFQRYVAVGIDKQIPILLPAGHMTLLREEEPTFTDQAEKVRALGSLLWNSGLAVIDDAHTNAYDWKKTDKREEFTQLIKSLHPGITHVIIHATVPSENFDAISGSGITRAGDFNAMLDPALKALIKEEGIILSSWKELQERRNALK